VAISSTLNKLYSIPMSSRSPKWVSS